MLVAAKGRPDLVKALVQKHGAKDSTIRKTAMAEIESMEPRPSQFTPGEEIPEKHWMYRLAKSMFFNDFGVYSELDPSKAALAPGRLREGADNGDADRAKNTAA